MDEQNWPTLRNIDKTGAMAKHTNLTNSCTDKEINCKNRGRRSFWLSTLDLKKRDLISWKNRERVIQRLLQSWLQRVLIFSNDISAARPAHLLLKPASFYWIKTLLTLCCPALLGINLKWYRPSDGSLWKVELSSFPSGSYTAAVTSSTPGGISMGTSTSRPT